MWKLNLFIITIFAACSGEVLKVDAQQKMADEDVQLKISSDSVAEKIDSQQYNYSIEMLLGHFDPAEHPDYVLVDKRYADREGLMLHKDTYQSFIEMYEAAERDSVQLVIRSATRNFDYQKGIWERKWTGETKVRGADLSKAIADPKLRALKILEYSSMPGTSRHHWGSDIDFNNFDNEWFEKGKGRKLWDWLEANAADYGFCRPYTKKDSARPHGYQEERWHWSYMPLSSYFMTLAAKEHSDSKITGFLGSEVAREIEVVDKYVFGINKNCLPK
jgi:LAS superfamily LD-carboxypeptidase LdcB